MKNVSQLSSEASAREFDKMLTAWQNNAGELSKHSRSNPKVREMCQQVCEALDCIQGWAKLSGSIMLVTAYQPNMFDDEEFGRGADWNPR